MVASITRVQSHRVGRTTVQRWEVRFRCHAVAECSGHGLMTFLARAANTNIAEAQRPPIVTFYSNEFKCLSSTPWSLKWLPLIATKLLRFHALLLSPHHPYTQPESLAWNQMISQCFHFTYFLPTNKLLLILFRSGTRGRRKYWSWVFASCCVCEIRWWFFLSLYVTSLSYVNFST
jgi:hypothetical protein